MQVKFCVPLCLMVLSLSACEMTQNAVTSSFSDFVSTETNTVVTTEQSGLINASSNAGTNLGSF